MRDAYGEVLIELGKELPELVVLDADLAKATKTAGFGEAYPERFFDMGIAEANLIGVAAGLALLGKIAVASTFAVFAPGRTYDQIRNTVCYSKANVKIIATHAGFSGGADGGSHQALEDIALARVIPNLRVYAPADAYETKLIVREAVMTPGPAYIRLSRSETPVLFDASHPHRPGLEIVRPGRDGAIVACGALVPVALQAAESLAAEGIACAVANVHTIKPLDEEGLIELAEATGCIVTAEEHSVHGGLGGAVAEVLSARQPVPVIRVGARDCFGQSASAAELLQEYGLTSEDIAGAVRQALERKERRNR